MRYYIFLLLLFSFSSWAEIYSTQDKLGNIIYSDVPSEHSKTVVVSPTADVVTDHADDTATTTNTIVIDKTKPANYRTFTIISPKEQETIQNQPVFPVEVSLEPELKPGARIQLLIDGKPSGDAVNSTHLQASILERGAHTLEAAIIDENNIVLQKSNSVSINVHRNSRITSPASY